MGVVEEAQIAGIDWGAGQYASGNRRQLTGGVGDRFGVWFTIWHHLVGVVARGASDAKGASNGIAEFGDTVPIGVALDLHSSKDQVAGLVSDGWSASIGAISVGLAAISDDTLEDVGGFVD